MAVVTPELAIAAIVKDEAAYLDEWIAFHEIVGVEHFYLYDNGSADETREILAGRTNVTVYDWPGERQQLNAYANALVRCDAKWLAFLDADEFLFSPDYLPLPTVLEDYENASAVGVCWAMFGTSGFAVAPEGGVIANYDHRAVKDDPVHRHVKSIVQSLRARGARPSNPHVLLGVPTVDTLYRPLDGPFAQSVTWEALRINHYWSKSIAEADAKSERARADNGQMRDRTALLSAQLNLEVDETIIPYAPLVEARLGVPA